MSDGGLILAALAGIVIASKLKSPASVTYNATVTPQNYPTQSGGTPNISPPSQAQDGYMWNWSPSTGWVQTPIGGSVAPSYPDYNPFQGGA